MSGHDLPLAVSLGDPSGIGPDILLKAWVNGKVRPLPDLIAIGDAAFMRRRALQIGIEVLVQPVNEFTTELERPDALRVFNPGIEWKGEPGRPEATDAIGTIAAIREGVRLTVSGTASGLVTCPINKHVLYKSGFEFPGHTEFLAHLATELTGLETTPVMLLAGPELKTVPVTIHVPLSKVIDQLTPELLRTTIEITAKDLQAKFGIQQPRLAVAGLNPHAGESGALGAEDDSIIRPVIEALANKGYSVTGPWPADTMFHESARQTYDVAICMYHDQALIPAKTLAFDDAVNVTLGLPFIRTSPDHGTAYDIAGTGKANPSSFVAAVQLAHSMATHQSTAK